MAAIAPEHDKREQHGMTEMAGRHERHYLRPVPGAADPLPNAFPSLVTRGLGVSLLTGALLGLLFAWLLMNHIITPPGWEQLFADGRLTFYVFWMFIGMAGGVLFGGVGTILAAPPVGSPVPAAEALPRHRTASRIGLYAAAGLTAFDGLLHMWVSPHHLEHYGAIAGVTMMLTSVAQFALAAALLVWASRWLILGNLGFTVLLIAVWGFTRIVGLPFGPQAWEPLHVGPIDVVSKSAEVVLLGALTVFFVRARTYLNG